MKKLEIEKTKPTFITSILKVEFLVGLVFSIFNFFSLLKRLWQIIGGGKKYLPAVIWLYQDVWLMYVQVRNFCIRRGLPTVPLTQILRNAVFLSPEIRVRWGPSVI